MRYLTFILIFLLVQACRTGSPVSRISTSNSSESTIYVGTVLSDTMTLINHESNYRSPILSSTSSIEIWFDAYPTFGNSTTYRLFFDSCWKIKYPSMNVHVSLAGKVFLLKDIQDSVIEKLVMNNIFSLPDDEETNMDSFNFDLVNSKFQNTDAWIFDGICYSISYKVGDRFRRYTFCNPEFYASQSAYITPFTYYARIVEIFGSIPIQ